MRALMKLWLDNDTERWQKRPINDVETGSLKNFTWQAYSTKLLLFIQTFTVTRHNNFPFSFRVIAMMHAPNQFSKSVNLWLSMFPQVLLSTLPFLSHTTCQIPLPILCIPAEKSKMNILLSLKWSRICSTSKSDATNVQDQVNFPFSFRFGINGKACVLRTICELAESKGLPYNGLLGRAFETLFL